MVAELNGRQQIVISSNGTVDGYDAATGASLWTVENVAGNTIPSVTVAGDFVYAGAAQSERGSSDKPQSTCCIKLNSGGDESAEIAWRSEKAQCHYVSPLVVGDCVYSVNNVGVLCCVDAATGETHYAKRTSGMCWATPIAAGDTIYLFGKDGRTTVIKSGTEYEELAVNELWDMTDPPTPETHVEYKPERPSRASMADRLKEADGNKDGKIEKSELPESMQSFFGRLDGNSDGVIDESEVKAMAERSRRRSESGSGSNSYGDPIVYGVAVGDGTFFVRTGTRMYCVRENARAVAVNQAND